MCLWYYINLWNVNMDKDLWFFIVTTFKKGTFNLHLHNAIISLVYFKRNNYTLLNTYLRIYDILLSLK